MFNIYQPASAIERHWLPFCQRRLICQPYQTMILLFFPKFLIYGAHKIIHQQPTGTHFHSSFRIVWCPCDIKQSNPHKTLLLTPSFRPTDWAASKKRSFPHNSVATKLPTYHRHNVTRPCENFFLLMIRLETSAPWIEPYTASGSISSAPQSPGSTKHTTARANTNAGKRRGKWFPPYFQFVASQPKSSAQCSPEVIRLPALLWTPHGNCVERMAAVSFCSAGLLCSPREYDCEFGVNQISPPSLWERKHFGCK